MKIEISTINKKNSEIAPGLTIVSWGNENNQVVNLVEGLKRNFLDIDSCIQWYSQDMIHFTLIALTRTKYKKSSPLFKSELPNKLYKSIKYISGIKPFNVNIVGYSLREDGQIQLVGEVAVENINSLKLFKEIPSKIDPGFKRLDESKLKNAFRLHLNFGYVTAIPPDGIESFYKTLDEKITIEINKVSIVHYLRRTLESRYIVGQIHVSLEKELEFSSKYFSELLRIQ